MLWEEKLAWSRENEVYTIRMYHYPGGGIGLRVFDKISRGELYSEGLPKKPPARVETYTALPSRHLDQGDKRHTATG